MKKMTRTPLALCILAAISSVKAEQVIYDNSAVEWQYSEYLPSTNSEQVVVYEQQPVYTDKTVTYESTQPQSSAGGYEQYAYDESTYTPQAVPVEPAINTYQAVNNHQNTVLTHHYQSQTQTQTQQQVAHVPTPRPTPQISPNQLGAQLLNAARGGELQEVRRLLRAGADPDYKAHSNALSPLDLVVQGGWLNVARIFQQEGVSFDKIGNQGITFLHQAAAGGKLPLVQFLVNAGVNPNTPTAKGWTPLHHAARFGHAPVVSYLLRAGANPNQRNSDGFSPQDLATNARHTQVASLF